MQDDDLSEFLDIFITETKEAFAEMDNDLVNLEHTPGDMELIQSIFRRMHTIKGSASIFDFKTLKSTAHKLEDLMDWVRKNAQEVSHEIIDLLFEGVDHLKSIFQGFIRDPETKNQEGRKSDQDFLLKLDEHMERLNAGEMDLDICAKNSFEAFEKVKELLQSDSQFNEIIQHLESLGKCFRETGVDGSEEKELESKVRWFFRGEEVTEFFVPWTNFLKRCSESEDVDSAKIMNFFSKFKSLAEVLNKAEDKDVENVVVEIEESISLFEVQELEMDELMVEYFSSVTKDIEKLLDSVEPEDMAPIEDKPVQKVTLEQKKDSKIVEMGKTIRVNEEKIDMFLNSVGELITIGEVFNYIEKKMDNLLDIDPAITKEYKSANMVFADEIFTLHESLIELRRVEIKQVLNNTPRLVRDLAKSMGKEITLTIKGDDSYLDKSLLSDLDAMLMHIVRNSIDHGIESGDERKKAGKLPKGEIRIEAKNDDKFLHVYVKDDGRGIDVDKVKTVALEKDLVAEAKLKTMSEEDIINLIFMSGMTTAKEVSEVSGRGVGMDVVLSGIKSQGGNVNITTEKGHGTTFHLQIPLSVTLGVISGLVVKVQGNSFVVPIENILETFIPEKDQIITVKQIGEAINVRNKLFPMIRLDKLFSMLRVEGSNHKSNEICILIKNKEKEAGIWVDELLEQQQVVLKRLVGLPKSQNIMGGAIMGDGKVGLVLNIEGLLASHSKS